MTNEQRELARHALGFPNRRKKSYRNHFCASEGHYDYANWMLMVEAGDAVRFEPRPITGGDYTFGVGFQCTDGVVLCSDRQMTSDAGYKFHRQKTSWSFNEPRELRFIFTFSGRPAAAAVLFRKVRNTFADEYNKLAKKNIHGVREKSIVALEKIFRDRNSKEANILVGISIANCPPFLLRTQGSKVLEAHTEYMGSGDSSALRLVCDTLVKRHLTVEKAKILGAYIISVANRFAEGCSGGPDIISLARGGIIQQASREFIRNTSEQFGQFEEVIEKQFSKISYEKKGPPEAGQ